MSHPPRVEAAACAPWVRQDWQFRTVLRERCSRRTVYREDVPPGEVPPTRRYTTDTYEDEYRR